MLNSNSPPIPLQATIMVVDDTPDILIQISELLKDKYKLKLANSARTALRHINDNIKPDLILLDIMMPEMSGYDVIRELKNNIETKDIPVIFLTAMTSVEDEKRGLESGAVDYITKPISPAVMEARIKTHLENKAAADFIRNKNTYLEAEIKERTKAMEAIQDVTIFTMTSLAETRDLETGNHILRTQQYIKALALELQPHPRFNDFLSQQNIELIFKSAPLHDIGKVGIPDRILLKPGRLTVDEFEIMKTHTTIGYNAIVKAEEHLGTQVDFLQFAKEIAYFHQEKWDGSGYPTGASGDDIPVSARLMALADVYDALISRRVYKEPMSHEKAKQIIVEGKGTHFDPDVVDAFCAIDQTFYTIASTYSDNEKDLDEKSKLIKITLGNQI